MTWCSLKGVLELAAELATSRTPLHGPFLGALRVAPFPLFHGGAVALASLEDEVLHPLASRRAWGDAWFAMSAVDGDGRLGLRQQVACQHADYTRYIWAADMGTLLLHLLDSEFREQALAIENASGLHEALAAGRGAVIAGLHLGPHAAIPLILAQLGYDVAVLGAAPILEKGERLSRACLPDAAARLAWLPLGERVSLLCARSTLRSGGLVVAYIEQIVVERGSKATEVTLFGRRVRTSAVLPYLASLTKSPIVPASIVRERGPRFTLRFESPLPPPQRNEHAMRDTLQRLFSIAQTRALEHPEQWLLWQQLAAEAAVSERGKALGQRRPAYAVLS